MNNQRMKEADLNKSRNRDDYTRCKICLVLFVTAKAEMNKDGTYICPNGCVESFNQPPYESPFQE